MVMALPLGNQLLAPGAHLVGPVPFSCCSKQFTRLPHTRLRAAVRADIVNAKDTLNVVVTGGSKGGVHVLKVDCRASSKEHWCVAATPPGMTCKVLLLDMQLLMLCV